MPDAFENAIQEAEVARQSKQRAIEQQRRELIDAETHRIQVLHTILRRCRHDCDYAFLFLLLDDLAAAKHVFTTHMLRGGRDVALTKTHLPDPPARISPGPQQLQRNNNNYNTAGEDCRGDSGPGSTSGRKRHHNAELLRIDGLQLHAEESTHLLSRTADSSCSGRRGAA